VLTYQNIMHVDCTKTNNKLL